MAPKKNGTPAKRAYDRADSQPQYPYTPKPGSLRKFLQLVPTKPKPTKVNESLLKTWGFKSSNDRTIARVLKQLGLLGSDGSTTNHYAAFMQKDTGPGALGARIRAVYPKLFESFNDPGKASVDDLTNFSHEGDLLPVHLDQQARNVVCGFTSRLHPLDGHAGCRASRGAAATASTSSAARTRCATGAFLGAWSGATS